MILMLITVGGRIIYACVPSLFIYIYVIFNAGHVEAVQALLDAGVEPFPKVRSFCEVHVKNRNKK